MGLEITDTNIDDVLMNNEITVVDFSAPWCGPCRMLSPIIDELSLDNPKLAIGKLNVDDNPLTANKYGIRGIPAIFFFKNGEIADKLIGMTTKIIIQEKINKLLN